MAAGDVLFFLFMMATGRSDGSRHLVPALVVNAAWLCVLALSRWWAMSKNDIASRTALGTVFFAGIFWCAFPLALSASYFR